MQTSPVSVFQYQNQFKASGEPQLPVRELLFGLVMVCLASALVFFSGLGSFPLFNPDESLYAEPAREMLVTGEYITTLLNYVVRFTKPPLVIWAMAGCFQIFGVSEFAARFFGAACGVILSGCTYLFIAHRISPRFALPAGLTLASAPLFLGTAREAITDMPLSLFLAGAQMAFYNVQLNGFKNARLSALITAYVLIGLAVMTKGPVGVVLPVAILFAWHLLKGDLLQALRAYKPLLGASIIAAIALPWFVTEITITHGAYFQEFIVRENFQRFTANVDSHKQPVWYHLAAMAGGYFPWTLFLPPAIYGLVAPYIKTLIASLGTVRETSAKTILKIFETSAAYLKNLSPANACALYSLLWATITLVFYSASVSKLLPYTLPAFPALAVILANYLSECKEKEAGSPTAAFRGLALPVLAMILVYGVAGLVAPHLTTKLRHAPAELITIIAGYSAAQAVVCLSALVLLRLRRDFAMTYLAVATALCLVSYLGRTLNVVSSKWEGELPAYSRFAGLSQDPVIVFDMRKPGVPFYARRRVENINGFEPLTKRLAEIPSAYILCRTSSLPALQTLAGTKVMASQGDFAMVRVKR